MVENELDPRELFSQIPWDWEILSSFVERNNLFVNWIDCNYTWGWYDDDTGKWTGAIGKVNI